MNAANSTKTKEVTMYPDGRVDTRNASAYVGLSEKTLAMMRCNGNGPKFVKRGRIFYFREDLDSWLNAGGRFTSTAQAQHWSARCGKLPPTISICKLIGRGICAS